MNEDYGTRLRKSVNTETATYDFAVGESLIECFNQRRFS
jgi:hypothetical protein